MSNDSDSSYNTTDLSQNFLKSHYPRKHLGFIVVCLLTWHYAGTRDTYMSICMNTCTFHFPMHTAFLMLAHGFAHVLVSPAIKSVKDFLYIVAGQYMCYTGIAMLSLVA